MAADHRALWGTAYVAIKAGLADGDPYLFALLRFVLGSLVLLAFVLYLGRFDRRLLRNRTLWLIALLNAVCIALQNVGMTMTTATNAVLLFNINVGFVAILAAVILKEQPGPKVLLGICSWAWPGCCSSPPTGTCRPSTADISRGTCWSSCPAWSGPSAPCTSRRSWTAGHDVLMVTGAMFMLSVMFLVPITLAFADSYAMDGVAWGFGHMGRGGVHRHRLSDLQHRAAPGQRHGGHHHPALGGGLRHAVRRPASQRGPHWLDRPGRRNDRALGAHHLPVLGRGSAK